MINVPRVVSKHADSLFIEVLRHFKISADPQYNAGKRNFAFCVHRIDLKVYTAMLAAL